MKFTKEAQDLFLKLLKDNHMDYISISVNEEGEEANVQIQLLSKDEVLDKDVRQYDQLSVLISDEDEYSLSEVVINADGDDIVLEIPHHHHDGECCCHHHEDGECCHHEHEEGEEHHCCCCED